MPAWPCAVGQALAVLRHGPADPTVRFGAGVYWRGLRTPAGPATLRLELSASGSEIRAAAWGSGADWAVESVPAMLGAEDDPTGFRADRHPRVAQLAHRFPHLRLPRTNLVMESLVPAIIEQRVAGNEAFAGYRRLVHFYGDRAPGPGEDLRLWVPPRPTSSCRSPRGSGCASVSTLRVRAPLPAPHGWRRPSSGPPG
ncbi:hypothetical protein [Georgenia sp. SUBG003]|uniref:hypothetical protein n=1 Tax=Georgenia sp. SUBG003 TaxID=1497974 RepID=UPI000A8EC432